MTDKMADEKQVFCILCGCKLTTEDQDPDGVVVCNRCADRMDD